MILTTVAIIFLWSLPLGYEIFPLYFNAGDINSTGEEHIGSVSYGKKAISSFISKAPASGLIGSLFWFPLM